MKASLLSFSFLFLSLSLPHQLTGHRRGRGHIVVWDHNSGEREVERKEEKGERASSVPFPSSFRSSSPFSSAPRFAPSPTADNALAFSLLFSRASPSSHTPAFTRPLRENTRREIPGRATPVGKGGELFGERKEGKRFFATAKGKKSEKENQEN